jgi:hypothetical protein
MAQSRERLRHAGVAAPDAAAEASVRCQLLELHAAGQVELRLRDVPCSPTPTGAFAAAPITRWEAERRPLISTPTHQRLPLTEVDRLIVTRLTGAASIAEVENDVVQLLRAGTTAFEGTAGSTPEMLVQSRLAWNLLVLDSWGLAR